jgi:hypothetical protein
MSHEEDDDYDDGLDKGHDLEVIVPTEAQWKEAAYLQLKPYDASRAMQIEGDDHRPFRFPLLGTIRHYSVELVFEDDTWEFLHFGTELDEAKRIIQRLAAQHDLPIARHFPERSDVEGY